MATAVLACHWVYAKVGEHLACHLPESTVSRRWPLTYSGHNFHRNRKKHVWPGDGPSRVGGAKLRGKRR